MPVVLSPGGGAVRIPIRVVPRASRTTVGGVRDGRLLVRVTAPPVDRAANDAAVSALAGALDVPPRSVSIVSGATARNKTVEVRGLTAVDVAARIRPLCEAAP
ncbi:MAG: DUF167 domain-containing protein [Acidobacteria bacterium]|nr:DUF167 domain-containing protein [Acidobacteriota bacterium]